METKVCKKCGVEKLLCEFDKDKNKKDGLSYRCKKCRREYINQYNLVNIEKKRELGKKVIGKIEIRNLNGLK